jgi:hypothetical protein
MKTKRRRMRRGRDDNWKRKRKWKENSKNRRSKSSGVKVPNQARGEVVLLLWVKWVVT